MPHNTINETETVQFESPADLAHHIFDEAVEPGDTGKTRLRLALLSGVFARRKWRDLRGE